MTQHFSQVFGPVIKAYWRSCWNTTILIMQSQATSPPDIVLDHISVATGVVPVLYRGSLLYVFAKSMRIVTPHVSAVTMRHAEFLPQA